MGDQKQGPTWSRKGDLQPRQGWRAGAHLLRILAGFPHKVTLSVLILGMVLGYGGVFDLLNENFAKPIEFRLRSAAGLDPKLDKRIAVFAFDDVTASKLGRQHLNFAEWTEILTHLSKQRPKQIIIDQVFQIIEQSPELEQLLELKSDFAPLSAAMFSSLWPISGRSAIDENPHWALKANHGANDGEALRPTRSAQPPAKETYVYGPDPRIRPLFSGFGAINYSRNGMMPALVTSPSGALFPTLGMIVADDIRTSHGNIVANNQVVPRNRYGEIQVNQGRMSTYYDRTRTIASLLEAARQGKTVAGIDEDSYVFLLPMMYTGNADFKSTPLGEFPGGLLHVAVANSVLTNSWISFSRADVWMPFAAMLLAVLLASLLTPFRSSVLILCEVFLTVGAGLALFVYQGVVVSWAESGAMALLVGLTAVAEKSRVIERRSLQIRHTLAGLVPPKLLGVLLRAPSRILGHSRRAEVSVMFVDIEGFSLRMQDEDPDIVFDHLKSELGRLCEIVQRYGGIVDKTLGDGLLCYFGYNFDPEYALSDREHAFTAMSCALEIQIDSARRAVRANEQSSPGAAPKGAMVFPLRIGINSGEVFIGNVGNRDRIDLTIVGSAVNWAKRYEDVCESFRIMVGPRTKEIMTRDTGDKDVLVRIGDRKYTLYHREIIVKHYQEKGTGWECNPFEKSLTLLADALHAVNSVDAAQVDERRAVDLPATLNGTTQVRLISLDKSGATVVSPHYLSKRDTIEMECHAGERLAPLRLRAQVLWGIQDGQVSRHGLRFVEMSAADSRALGSTLQALLDASARSA